MPRAAKYVLVEHTSGARKEVLRTTWLRGLGPHWKRVSTSKKRPPSEAAGDEAQSRPESTSAE